ncbi:hypothetical protein HPP92_028051 [Vanilla planifolia]|uniref:SHSP domain-containing protein n=1 Tax=Vanilla planifolia TaxID=51239 RepID=A0A835P7L9_VANPL|nr:hypothetical protein HPP92_028051 [Vanilla planifolia]
MVAKASNPIQGFNEEHVKVEIDDNGKLRTSGERPPGPGQGDRWICFKTEHSIPNDCDLRRIRTLFDDGVLYVTLPKPINAQQTRIPEAKVRKFQPSTKWTSDRTTDTLVVRLPGFNKEELKVQIDNYGRLRTSGERPPGPGQGDRWIRFKTEHIIPDDCDLKGIRARFEDGVL